MLQELHVKTAKKEDIINITSEIESAVKKSKIKEGLCCIYAKHATAAIIINENADPAVCDDILAALNRMIPQHAGYKHNCIDNNAAAHIKSAIIGPGKVIPVKNNKLELGRWQGIALAEFDGPRERNVIVQIIENITK